MVVAIPQPRRRLVQRRVPATARCLHRAGAPPGIPARPRAVRASAAQPAARPRRTQRRGHGRGARRSQTRRRHAGPPLIDVVRDRFSQAPPGEETRRRGDEARQLAWRLWLTRAPHLWLVGPGARRAYRCSYAPLVLDTTPSLPSAEKLRLTRPPAAQMVPPTLH